MTEIAERLRDDYLARLEDALRAVPHGVASEIRRGILEEFHGLDEEGARSLVTRLGDPADIAAAAMADAAPAPAAVIAVPAPRGSVTGTRGFAVVAALALGFGGIVVPVVGWVIGAVLVSLSPLWRAGEKVVAVAVPVVSLVVSWILVHLLPGPAMIGFSGSSDFHRPGSGEANPLIPSAYDLAFGVAFGVALVIVPASGLWLLWRLRGRTAPR